MQTRDMVWHLLVQLDLVVELVGPLARGDQGAPPAELRYRFLATVTRLAELEAAERRSRQSSNQDASALVVMLDRFRGLVVTIHEVVRELQAKAKARQEQRRRTEAGVEAGAEIEDEAEVEVGAGGPAARIVKEVKEFLELIKVTSLLRTYH